MTRACNFSFFEWIAKGSNLLEHVVVGHASPDQELLSSVGMDEILPDPAKDDSWLLCDCECVLNINQGQKPSVDIGMRVAASWHDLNKDQQLITPQSKNESYHPCQP